MKKLFLAIVAAAAFVASPALSQQQGPTFKLCTGNSALNYFKAGHILKSKISNVNVEVIETKGSLDNLDKVTAGECDGAFVQSDAMLVYSNRNAKAISSLERVGILYQEFAHLICNRAANIDRVTDLGKQHTIAVGPDGSGARTTWDAFVLADKKRYSPVQINVKAGVRALNAVAEGTEAQCMLTIAALNSSFVKGDVQQHGDRVIVSATDDWDMGKVAEDSRGQPVYGYSEIPAGTYPRIQPTGTVYGTKAVKAITVDAIFVANNKWIESNESKYDGLLRAFANAKPSIEALIKPQ